MNQGPISHWPNTCWNIQESSSWCVEETNVLTLFVVQLASFLPPSTTEILCHEPYTVLALSEKPGQKAAFHRGEDLSVRISASWHTAAGQAHSGQHSSEQFFSLLFFFTLSNCFHASPFHFYTTFSMSSLHCLLTSWIKTQFRNWSILRSSNANRTIHCRLVLALIFPGNPGPHHSHGQHQEEAQGVLTHHSCCTHSKSSASQCARYTGCSHTSSKGFNWLPGTAGKGCSIQTFFNLRGLCDIRDQT